MGTVYLSHTRGGQPVALKVIRREYAQDEEFRRRFQQEVQAARRVQGYHVVPVVDHDTTGERPWLATTYVPGLPLDEALLRFGPLPLPAVLQLVGCAAEALRAIHAAGVIHRDLKPSNVLLAANGPWVIDFGIARAADSTQLTRSGGLIGTPQFMSPEHASGLALTPATDVFSLGLIAGLAATGRHPYGDAGAITLATMIANTAIKPPDLTGYPEPLRDVLTRCLTADPAARPAPAELARLCEAGAGRGLRDFAGWLPAPVAAEITRRESAAARPPVPPAAGPTTADPLGTAYPSYPPAPSYPAPPPTPAGPPSVAPGAPAPGATSVPPPSMPPQVGTAPSGYVLQPPRPGPVPGGGGGMGTAPDTGTGPGASAGSGSGGGRSGRTRTVIGVAAAAVAVVLAVVVTYTVTKSDGSGDNAAASSGGNSGTTAGTTGGGHSSAGSAGGSASGGSASGGSPAGASAPTTPASPTEAAPRLLFQNKKFVIRSPVFNTESNVDLDKAVVQPNGPIGGSGSDEIDYEAIEGKMTFFTTFGSSDAATYKSCRESVGTNALPGEIEESDLNSEKYITKGTVLCTVTKAGNLAMLQFTGVQPGDSGFGDTPLPTYTTLLTVWQLADAPSPGSG
ncbi:serine/threonine-protein kinase [Actinacidiphila acididurans]|uniref:non-specific serine/threonine protein kinase n=1 Tax=Actinacidiphila acididurans TaxID=2784346 RepID=A0ABS2U3Z6_9ACTN|nr:serine/threonine protein kinase [Actinacidiphila acididurans]